MNPHLFREFGKPDLDERISPDVHGLSILPDDGKPRWTSHFGPVQLLHRIHALAFVRDIEQAWPGDVAAQHDAPPLRRAIRLLNLAMMTEDSTAKALLAISAVESLVSETAWTDKQRKIVKDAAEWVTSTYGAEAHVAEIAKALGDLRSGSIRQGTRKLLAAEGLSDLWPDWDELYARRSRVVHPKMNTDSEHTGKRLTEPELYQLGRDATKLCATIVLSAVGRAGLPLPEKAKARLGIQ